MTRKRIPNLMMVIVIGFALTMTTAMANPEMSFPDGDTVEIGRIGKGHYKQTVQVRNTGVDTLRIEEIKTSCGCTAAPISKSEIEPGGSAEIQLSYHSNGSPGVSIKKVTIRSNDPARNEHVLYVRATIVEELRIDRSFLVVPDTMIVGETYKAVFYITNLSSDSIPVGFPVAMDETVGLLLASNVKGDEIIVPGETREITVSIEPLKEGEFYTKVKVPVNGQYTKEMHLHLHGRVRSNAK